MMFLLKDITTGFNGKTIFESFNLQLNEREKLLITAPSGTGKTTLLKILQGFVAVQSGKVLYNQKEMTAETVRDVRQNISYLSQDVDFPNGKVITVLFEFFDFSANKNLRIDRATILKQMKELKLETELLDKNMNELSGGERQRLGWVVLKILNRPVLLLDEPTSALDKELKQQLINYIIESDKTVIVISHDQEWQKPGFKILSSFSV